MQCSVREHSDSSRSVHRFSICRLLCSIPSCPYVRSHPSLGRTSTRDVGKEVPHLRVVAAHPSFSWIKVEHTSGSFVFTVLSSGFGGKYRDFDPLGKQAYLDQVALIQDRECRAALNAGISHVQRCNKAGTGNSQYPTPGAMASLHRQVPAPGRSMAPSCPMHCLRGGEGAPGCRSPRS